MEYVWAAAQAQPDLSGAFAARDGHRITGAIKKVAAALAALEQHKSLHPAEAALVLANGATLLATTRAAEVGLAVQCVCVWCGYIFDTPTLAVVLCCVVL